MKTSYGEQLCRGLLARWFPEEKVVYNYRPEWLKNPETGRRLELDIYYPDLKLAVEFNGSQHKLFLQKRKDYFKFQQCLKLGIVLLVVYHPMDIYKCKGLVRRHTGVKTPSGREDEAFLWEMKAYSPTEDGSSKWYVEAKSKSEEAEKAKKEAWRARKLQRKKIEA